MQASVSSLLLLVGLFCGYHAHGLGLWTDGEPGAGLFPFIFSVLLGVVMLIDLASHPWPMPRAAALRATLTNRRFMAYIAGLLLYVGTFSWLGFVPSTVLAFALTMRVGEQLAWPRVAGLTAVAVAAAYLVLQRLLGVPLPAGLLG